MVVNAVFVNWSGDNLVLHDKHGAHMIVSPNQLAKATSRCTWAAIKHSIHLGITSIRSCVHVLSATTASSMKCPTERAQCQQPENLPTSLQLLNVILMQHTCLLCRDQAVFSDSYISAVLGKPVAMNSFRFQGPGDGEYNHTFFDMHEREMRVRLVQHKVTAEGPTALVLSKWVMSQVFAVTARRGVSIHSYKLSCFEWWQTLQSILIHAGVKVQVQFH